MSVIWYAWGDATFREIGDPGRIAQLDTEAALDEPENSFFWAPQCSMETRQYRNEGMGPQQLAEYEARAQGVLADGELVQSAQVVARFDTRSNRLLADAAVTPVDMVPLRLQLIDAEPGFEVLNDG